MSVLDNDFQDIIFSYLKIFIHGEGETMPFQGNPQKKAHK